MAGAKQGCEDVVCIGLLLILIARFLLVKQRLYHLKFGFAYFSSLVITGFWSPIFLFRPRDVRNLKYARSFVSFLAWILGVFYHVRGSKNLQTDRQGIIVCNHQSTLDVLIIMKLSPLLDAFTIIAKKGLFFIWPFGLCAWLAGVIFVSRGQPAKSYKALDGAKLWLKKFPTCKFWFFPEGTRNQNANKSKTLLPFKKGAFRIAVACQAPIIPIVNSPYYFVNKSKYFFSRGTVITEILPAIETTGMTDEDVDSLMDKTYKIMQNKYDELYREVEAALPLKYPGLVCMWLGKLAKQSVYQPVILDPHCQF